MRFLGTDSPLYTLGLFVLWVVELVAAVAWIAANCPWWIALPFVIAAGFYAIWFVTRDDA